MQYGKGYLTGRQAIREASESTKSITFCDRGQPLLHKHTPLRPSRRTEEINTSQQGH